MSTNPVSLTPEDITLLIKVAENCLRFSENVDSLVTELNVSIEDLKLVKEKAASYLSQ